MKMAVLQDSMEGSSLHSDNDETSSFEHYLNNMCSDCVFRADGTVLPSLLSILFFAVSI